MDRFVVLTASADAQAEGYDVRLGPLAFVTTADTVSETVGDGLEAVGAALVAADRAPRPLKLKLPVRGYHRDIDAKESGLRLRRQVRAVLDNARWRLSGFYFVWDPDEDLDGWLMVGGAELSESDPGISFGEYEMDLSDVYIVGRPGTHRPGRRARIGDRRTGLIARDTRRLLYSTDFAAEPLPDEPLVLPGDIVDLVASGNRPVDSVTLGPLREARRLWRTVSASDAEILSYLPDTATLPGRERYLDLEEAGAVRVWDLSEAPLYPPSPDEYTLERDTDPNLYWSWERVLGDVLTADRPLAVDNGVCRLVWLGAATNQGLAIEYWDEVLDHFVRAGRVLHAVGVREQRVIELTPERAVLEWRAGQYGMRAILQRGWWGPRLESFDDGGGDARLEFAPEDGAPTVTPQVPTWVRALESEGIVDRTNLVTNPKAGAGATTGWTNNGMATLEAVTLGSGGAPAPSAEMQALGLTTGFHAVGDGTNDYAHISAPVANGQSYRYSLYVYIDSLSATRLEHYVYDPTPGTVKSLKNHLTTLDQWLRVDISFTADADAADWQFLIQQFGAGAADFYFTGVMVEQSDELGEYFDGDSDQARWTGTPHASTSELLEREPIDTLWASGSADETVDTAPDVIYGDAVSFRRERVIVAQLAPALESTPAALAALSLVDARPVPVLVGRG